jgi:ketosteroid isomerase-like protein
MKDKVDPQLRQQLDAAIGEFDEAFNKNDAAAVAALYTDDAVLVTDTGIVYGRQAIEQYRAELLHEWRFDNHIARADQYSPHATTGNEMWVTGEWSCAVRRQSEAPSMQVSGFWSAIYVRDGDAWKMRMEIYNVTPGTGH